MDDRALRAFERLERAPDQWLARLRQHLHRHVVGNQPLVDQAPDEIELGLRGRRKADLDFLEAELDQQAEHPHFPLGVHRLDQRLVAVAKIDAAPRGRAVDAARGPSSVGQLDRRVRPVFACRVDLHGDVLETGARSRAR